MAMKSDVTVGQSTSPSDVFDSIPYTGVELKSDSDMLPDSEKGYAPIIRGSAHSNAQASQPERAASESHFVGRCLRAGIAA
ncbi:chaperone-usher secretion system usher domain protein [Enterobacter hormaechei subsp. xiangfangensis]|nr:chaperone-usher secretion system usher domain protein [Enterobacter hormaechei subsp. xiangfangensis]